MRNNLIYKIAWASLLRRRTRSLLVVIMISASLWGLLFIEGIYDGMTEQLISNSIRSSCGHLAIYAKGYRLDPDIGKSLVQTDMIDRILEHDKTVVSFTRRIVQDGLVSTAKYSRGGAIYGVDLDSEQKHGRLAEYLVAGRYDFGERGRLVLIGAKLADKLKVSVGRKIVVTAQNSDNEVSALALKVGGIFRTNNLSLDERAVFISMAKARELLNMKTGVTRYAVMLDDEDHIAALKDRIASLVTGVEVFSWSEIFPALLQGRVMMEGFNMVTSLLVFFVAGLGIFGVMLVSVLERIREFGILIAVGTRFSQIWQIVLTESLMLGYGGYLGGTLLGGATLLYFYYYGFDLSRFSEGFEMFGMDSVTYALIKPGYFVTSFIAVTVATLTSIVMPLRILKRSRPVEAIRKI